VTDVQLSWFVYVVRLTDTFSQDQRDAIVRMLHQGGISCGRYFAPIHSQPAYAGLPVRWPLPVTESISRRTLALPFFSRLREEEVKQVTRALRESIEAASH
jgi:perosamine synthetase